MSGTHHVQIEIVMTQSLPSGSFPADAPEPVREGGWLSGAGESSVTRAAAKGTLELPERAEDSYRCHFLLPQEEGEKPLEQWIRFRPGMMMVREAGAIQTILVLRNKKRRTSDYITSFGTLPLTFETGRVDVVEKEDGVEVYADYTVEYEGEMLSEHQIELHITADREWEEKRRKKLHDYLDS